MRSHTPIIIGLTGGIGMGKSTIAKQFSYCNISVCDSDKIVHELLNKNGKAVEKVAKLFPEALKNKQIDRKILGQIVFSDKSRLKQLEGILHPLVRQEQEKFIKSARKSRKRIVVLDIPLLFETDSYKRCDYKIVVSTPAFLQKQRVLKRGNMTEAKFNHIIACQMPDSKKRKLADFVIYSGIGKNNSLKMVKKIIAIFQN